MKVDFAMSVPVAPILSSINPDVLARIPLTARHVLEIGCGTGALAARYRCRNPQARWCGIEPSAEAAGQARDGLDAVLAADPEAVTEAELDALFGGTAPDVLVVQQGFERWRDPARLLRRIVPRLAPTAVAVIAVANSGHWSVVRDLMAGRPPAREGGPVSPQDLHLYTIDSARDLLRSAGLIVRKQRAREIPLDAVQQEAFLAAAEPMLASLGVDPDRAKARLKALQYVLVAHKEPLPTLLEVHQLVMVRTLMEARVEPPWAALSSLPSVSATMSDGSLKRGPLLPGAPKILVIQRQLVGELAPWLAYMKRLIADGWVLVAEWDDHPDLLPSPAQETWQRHPWLPMTMVHACEVSTDRLAEAFRAHNPETQVLENALLDVPPPSPRDPGTVRVLYASVNRPGVSRLISPGLDAISDDPRVEIVVAGDEKVFASTRALRKRYLPLQDYASYVTLLGQADIVVAPLRGEPSELYKSPLKALEAASRGALFMGSPSIYEGVVEHGRTGWLPGDQGEWTRLLKRAVAEDDERRTMADAGWTRVRERHMQAQHVGRREAWYRDLAARRAELTEAIYRRHPEMKP